MSGNSENALLLDLTAQIVSAHVAHNATSADAVSPLIASVLKTLRQAGSATETTKGQPAVPLNKSVFADHIICLECGASFKILKRHLHTDHDLTPEMYRTKWGLSRSYPVVAADYAKRRSVLAKKIGLGSKPRSAGGVAKKVQATSGRPKKAA